MYLGSTGDGCERGGGESRRGVQAMRSVDCATSHA